MFVCIDENKKKFVINEDYVVSVIDCDLVMHEFPVSTR